MAGAMTFTLKTCVSFSAVISTSFESSVLTPALLIKQDNPSPPTVSEILLTHAFMLVSSVTSVP